MLAILENDVINVYNNENNLIGSIKSNSDLTKTEITTNNKIYNLVQNKLETKVFEGDQKVYNLKTNSFSGSTEILETNKKITGEWGFKWATKMIDNENNTLLKIRNEKQIIHNNRYEIQMSNDNTTDFDILLTLYRHLQASRMKQTAVAIASLVTTMIMLDIIY